jgi:hypothetical protein
MKAEMDPQLVKQTKEFIKNSELTQEAKTQLLSLMDFLNYPEVKERILKILDVEKKVTNLELKYLKELDKKFRESDLFGYSKSGMHMPSQQQVAQSQEGVTQQPGNNAPVQPATPPQNQQPVNQPSLQPNIGGV